MDKYQRESITDYWWLILSAWVLFGVFFIYTCYRVAARHQQPSDIPPVENKTAMKPRQRDDSFDRIFVDRWL